MGLLTILSMVGCGFLGNTESTPEAASEGADEEVEEVQEVQDAAAQAVEQVAATATEGNTGGEDADAEDGAQSALMNPAGATQTAPAEFTIVWTTTEGEFEMACSREWAPNGADRLYNLVQVGYYTDIAVFRIIDGFMAQFGMHGDPTINGAWKDARIQDDPGVKSNTRGYVSFATSGPNTRTTQLFINFGDNSRLDASGFTPVCIVDEDGMAVVDKLHSGYGEGAPRGRGPAQGQIQRVGNTYLKAQFPELDYIVSAAVK